jgi:predicted peroxiredoxin
MYTFKRDCFSGTSFLSLDSLGFSAAIVWDIRGVSIFMQYKAERARKLTFLGQSLTNMAKELSR